MHQLEKGAVLKDRYRIVNLLGKGGMAAVYLAEDEAFGSKQCAIKELYKVFWEEDLKKKFVEQFRLEAKILSSLFHPSLAKVSDYFEENSREYLVMEYVKGKNLFQIIEESKTFLREKDVLEWVSQICDVLTYLHTHNPPVIFRDLKPPNIILTDEKQIKLIDFGIAKIYDPEIKTKTIIKGVGSPGFSPPEQYGTGKTDTRTDVYSLGATIYHLLTNTIPEESIERLVNRIELEPPREINPLISAQTEKVILKAMELSPLDRYQSVTELKQDLFIQRGTVYGGKGDIICKNCGWRNRLKSKFCAKCGYLISEEDSLAAAEKPRLAISPTIVDLSPWTMFRGNEAHTGYRPFSFRLPLKLLWTYKAGDLVYSSPAVVDDIVYFGSQDKCLHALDTTTSNRLWKYRTGNGIDSSPCVCGDKVIFGSWDKKVYALDAINGELLWDFKTKGYIFSSPCVSENGTVVYVGSRDACLYALLAESGEKIWEYKMGEKGIDSSPVVAYEMIFIGTSEGYLYAIDSRSGYLLWYYYTGSSVLSSPCIDVKRGIVYIGSSSKDLYALAAEDGSLIWSVRTSGYVSSSPALAHDTVYFGSDDGYLYAVSAEKGELVWRHSAGSYINSSALVTDQYVIVGSGNGHLLVLDAFNGALLWEYRAADGLDSSPAIYGNKIFIGDNKGFFYVFQEAPL